MVRNPVSKLKRLQAEAAAFLDEAGILLQDQASLSRFHKFAHFWLIVVRGFMRNRCPIRATALAYTTLLALVPVLAIVLSVSTSLLQKEGGKPIQDLVKKFVTYIVEPRETIAASKTSVETRSQEVADQINTYISNVSTGTLGVTGVISLILVAILLLSTIESTLNDMWGVIRGRNWYLRVIYYWSIITLGPLILTSAVALTSGPYLTKTQNFINALPFVGTLVFSLMPFMILSLGFALFYQLMPNTRVQWHAALIGGAVGGTLWQLNNLFNVSYVSRVVSYSKIYGSLGMVPVFLTGLYFSWLFMLFGAQVAYAYQNRRAYIQEKRAETINQRGREFIAFCIMASLGYTFQQGAKPPSAADLASSLGVPLQLVSRILGILANAQLVFEGRAGEGFVPARPLDRITCEHILHAMRTGQGNDVIAYDGPARVVVREEFDRIHHAEQQAASSTTLQALVARVSPTETPSATAR